MAGVLLAGCARRAPATSSSVTIAPAEKRYPLKGEVVAVKPADAILEIHHEAIPDYMPSMTMEFIVSRGDAAIATVGERIRGDLIVRGGKAYLENIWPDDALTNSRIDASADALAQDTNIRGKGAYREIGETMPDVTLLDQEGRVVSISRFRGKQVMLNFIFTRCPIATMCPAATMKMMALQKAAHEAGVSNLELVSISFDPAYDTPGILHDYAAARHIDTSNFTFLTGPDAAVRQLLTQMGIIREFDGDTIKHTLATLLIDAQGRIIHRADGSQWDTEEFLAQMKKGA
ncbi:MAG TPA: SCO family protein [Candidatus Didemnitutus sp.]|jgi:protein SCO1/2